MRLFEATHLLQITSTQLNVHDRTRPPYAFVDVVLVIIVVELLAQSLVAEGYVLKDVPVIDRAKACPYTASKLVTCKPNINLTFMLPAQYTPVNKCVGSPEENLHAVLKAISQKKTLLTSSLAIN